MHTMSRPKKCPRCGCARMLDRSIYAGDYHSPSSERDFHEQWQCIRCGSMFDRTAHKLRYLGTLRVVLRPYEIDEAKVPV